MYVRLTTTTIGELCIICTVLLKKFVPFFQRTCLRNKHLHKDTNNTISTADALAKTSYFW